MFYVFFSAVPVTYSIPQWCPVLWSQDPLHMTGSSYCYYYYDYVLVVGGWGEFEWLTAPVGSGVLACSTIRNLTSGPSILLPLTKQLLQQCHGPTTVNGNSHG